MDYTIGNQHKFEFMKTARYGQDMSIQRLNEEIQNINNTLEGFRKDMYVFFDMIEGLRRDLSFITKNSDIKSTTDTLILKRIDLLEELLSSHNRIAECIKDKVDNIEYDVIHLKSGVLDNDTNTEIDTDSDDDSDDRDNDNDNESEDDISDDSEENLPSPQFAKRARPMKKQPRKAERCDDINCDECNPNICNDCKVPINISSTDMLANPQILSMITQMIEKELENENKEQIEKLNTNIDDSDEEYDENISVYDNDNKNETDFNPDFVVESVDDLIKLGEKYQKEASLVSKESKESKRRSTNQKQKNRILLFRGQTPDVINAIAIKAEDDEQSQESKDSKNEDDTYEFNGKIYSINIETLINLIKPLKRLNRMVGMHKVKNTILDMILYYLQGFEKKNNNMLHTIIEGPPGVGKTRLGKILAQVYSAMGIIPSNKFKLVRRTDLIGKYVGHTAHKTQEAIDEADGGVLFIDEAYSLGVEDNKDQFSKECIDVINQNLSENRKRLIVIIAGYAEQLDNCFFSYNEGLKRRFPFRFTIEDYSSTEMKDIFLDKVRKMKWKLCNDLNEATLVKFFNENKSEFPHFGGDIENLLTNCKFSHSRRVLALPICHKKIFNKDDLTKGFERFRKFKKEKDMDNLHLPMYA